MASGVFIDGAVKYPEDLPCPQVDTDLRPRERRYISDVGEVKKLRAFQLAFQATRQNISFVFTAEQSRRFRDWYKNEIIEGGAWFYADWPVLHREKRIAYRFVTRPVWEFLARKTYHVSATVETFFDRRGEAESDGSYVPRRIYKEVNVFTSKLYPYYFNDSIEQRGVTVKGMPYAKTEDAISLAGKTITQGSIAQYIFSTFNYDDAIALEGKTITAGTTSGNPFIYSSIAMQDESITLAGATITSGSTTNVRYISYDYFDDAIITNGVTITSGEIE